MRRLFACCFAARSIPARQKFCPSLRYSFCRLVCGVAHRFSSWACEPLPDHSRVEERCETRFRITDTAAVDLSKRPTYDLAVPKQLASHRKSRQRSPGWNVDSSLMVLNSLVG